MGYLYFEIITCGLSKKHDKPSGDVTETQRTLSSTIHILCDGVGSGIQANVAATMCTSRINELIKNGFSLRQSFANVVHSMEEARLKDFPCAFFTVVRVLQDGTASVLTYEMPPALFVTKRYSAELKSITHSFKEGIVGETDCSINKDEGIILMSDGITQAGMGKGLTNGWGIEGVNKFVSESLRNGKDIKELPSLILKEAKKNWKDKLEDDCTVSLIFCRRGKVINILTGPPVDPEMDQTVVRKFLNNDGLKIVCGASTAKIVARVMGKELHINPNFKSTIAPPNYEIDGIDLVTEGAVTLNQIYNIWGEEFNKLEKNSPVTDLYAYLNISDHVNIYLGSSKNPAAEDISFKQNGILSREKVIPLITEKLKNEGKIVSLEVF